MVKVIVEDEGSVREVREGWEMGQRKNRGRSEREKESKGRTGRDWGGG